MSKKLVSYVLQKFLPHNHETPTLFRSRVMTDPIAWWEKRNELPDETCTILNIMDLTDEEAKRIEGKGVQYREGQGHD